MYPMHVFMHLNIKFMRYTTQNDTTSPNYLRELVLTEMKEKKASENIEESVKIHSYSIRRYYGNFSDCAISKSAYSFISANVIQFDTFNRIMYNCMPFDNNFIDLQITICWEFRQFRHKNHKKQQPQQHIKNRVNNSIIIGEFQMARK